MPEEEVVEQEKDLKEKVQENRQELEKQKDEKTKYGLSGSDEVNLKELQIKLEKIKGYIRKIDARIAGNESILEKLRTKRIEVDNKRLEVSVIKKGKLERKV